MTEIVSPRAESFATTFPQPKPIIGMLHLRGETDAEKFGVACEEIDLLTGGGVDAVLVEDYFGSVDVASRVLEYLAKERPSVLYGVNILRNHELTFELAARYGAKFVQLDAVAGHLSPADDAAFGVQLERLCADSAVCVLGGVRFKYQPYLSGRTLAEDLMIATGRCDAVVVTGPGTGIETDPAKIAEFRSLLGPHFPLLVGAGVTETNLAEQLRLTDGALVGSFFKQNHRDDDWMEPEHIRRFMNRVAEIREAAGATR